MIQNTRGRDPIARDPIAIAEGIVRTAVKSKLFVPAVMVGGVIIGYVFARRYLAPLAEAFLSTSSKRMPDKVPSTPSAEKASDKVPSVLSASFVEKGSDNVSSTPSVEKALDKVPSVLSASFVEKASDNVSSTPSAEKALDKVPSVLSASFVEKASDNVSSTPSAEKASDKVPSILSASFVEKASDKGSSILSASFVEKASGNMAGRTSSGLRPISKINPIRNPKNNCFMNASFQLIMNNPELLSALKETYQQQIDQKAENANSYRQFLSLVDDYEKGRSIDLSPLRALLVGEGRREGTFGDANEFLASLLTPVNPAEYPDLFSQYATTRTYRRKTPLSRDLQLQLAQKKEADRLLTPTQLEKGRTFLSAIGEAKKTDPVHSLMIPLEAPRSNSIFTLFAQRSLPSLSGDELIQKQIKAESSVEGQEPVVCLQEGVHDYFTLVSEKKKIETFSKHLMVQLGRFYYTPDGYSGKIDTVIDMPIEFTVGEENIRYRLRSIIVHQGAHYWAVIRREGDKTLWHVANDKKVYKAEEIVLSEALQKGYIYDYEMVTGERS